MITTIEKRNQTLLYGNDLNGLSWTIKDLSGEVLGSSESSSAQVILDIKNLSKDGMTVALKDGITKDREVLVNFKYDYVPFSAKGIVEIAKKKSAYIRFINDSESDKVTEKMLNLMKSKKPATAEKL